ncbi:MAG: hypothetical protein ABI673_01620, partial [Novosphingobium sp.]
AESHVADIAHLLFRSASKIVPYIEIGHSKARLPIASVRIGPGPDQLLTAKSAEIFLETKGYNVPVNTSDVPFRS